MFKNLKKLNIGRIRVKVIATVLAIILTFANFILLGSYIENTSYAIETDLSEQNDSTNNENVKFEVYLDANQKELKEKIANINSEETKLYISVNIQNEGYLKDAKVKLESTNFKIKSNEKIEEIKLDTIKVDKGITLEIPVEAIRSEKYNLGLLNMISKIKLIGEYIDNKGNVTDIEETKEVRIIWKTDEISENDIELSQKVITNKICEINGEAKRVVQILVKSSAKGNIVPVKQTNIEMSIPEIGIEPEEVKVSSYSTRATNGKTAIEFADLETSSWEYKKETGKVYVEILNPVDENGNISWAKNAQDEIIVTYIYGKDAEIVPFISNAKSAVGIYGSEDNTVVEKIDNLSLEELQEIGNIVEIENQVLPEIYKGKLYIDETEAYTQTYNIYVSYKELAKKVQIEDLGDEILGGRTYYKKTAINKKEAINVLGTEGAISIYNAETKELIQTIDLSEETEKDYITVEYGEGVGRIIIGTSEAENEGKIEIISQKEIETIDEVLVKETKELISNVNLLVADENSKVIEDIKSRAEAKVIEPSTKYNVSLDKTKLIAGIENDLQITTELETENSSDKLFTNPEIRIEMPAEITKAKIENITPILHSEELELKSYEIITNKSGNKEIVIQTEGMQTEYTQNNAYVVIDLKLEINPFMANKDTAIKIVCVNGEEIIEENKNILLISKSGFVTKNTLSIGEETVEEINKNSIQKIIEENTNITMHSKLINNFGETLSNVNVVGTLADQMTLTGNILTNIEGAKVYYLERNGEKWVAEIQDLSKVKAFKIVIPNELEQASLVELEYKLSVNMEGISENTVLTNNLNINYEINKQAKQEKIELVLGALVKETIPVGISTQMPRLMKASAVNTEVGQVEIKISPKAMTEDLYQGQIVTYEIAVKNNGTKDLENPKIVYTVPEGAVLTELTYAQALEITYTDKEKIAHRTITFEGTLGAGKTRVAEITLRIDKDASQIVHNIEAQTAEGQTIETFTSNAIPVKKGDLSVMLSRRDNWESNLREGSFIQGIVIITNNTNKEMRNLEITSKLPEQASWVEDSEYNKDWTYNKQTGEISRRLNSLAAGKTDNIWFEIKVDKINEYEEEINNMALVVSESGDKFASNVYTNKVNKAGYKITMESPSNETLKEGENIKYVINVTNIGKRSEYITLIDKVPEDIYIQKVTLYCDGEKKEVNNIASISNYLEIGKKLTVEIEGKVKNLESGITNKKITNVAKVTSSSGEFVSNSVITTIVKDTNNPTKPEEPNDPNKPVNPSNPEKPSDPNDPENPEKPSNPSDPENPEKPNGSGGDKTTYSISGMVWLDKNKDGIREDSEEEIQEQRILLLDEKGKVIKETKSSLTGTYKFTNLEEGKYLVAIAYDEGKYAVTKYQVETAKESENSDIVTKQIKIDSKNVQVGITDTITISNKNIKNIDMGLIENPVFDLSLNKYISKVVVTTKEEAKTYEYEEPTNLAKVEISKKEISGASILVEYEIEIVNEGDVEGYVTDIIDYLPKELTFNSEMNPEWYMGSDGNLHYMALEPKGIEAGGKQRVKLVLTKNLKSSSTGTIKNIAEIGENTNLEGIAEKDSVAGNGQEGEDDISKAELIISIKTGKQVFYIGIVISSIIVLVTGIYIINKKVLR